MSDQATPTIAAPDSKALASSGGSPATHLGMTAKEWGDAYQELQRSNRAYQNAYQGLKKSSDKQIARLEWRIRELRENAGTEQPRPETEATNGN